MKYVLLGICLLFLPLLKAQELVSFSGSNYAGINAADINPSFIAYSRLRTDINFMQTRATVYTNNFFANPQFVPGLFFRDEVSVGIRNQTNADRSTNRDVEISAAIDAPTNLFANATIKGPGMMWSDGFKAFAIQTHFKTIGNVNNMSADLSRMLFEQTGYAPLLNRNLVMEKGAGASMMSYGSLDFSYAKMLNNRRNKIVNVGVTAKVLVGFQAMYFQSHGTAIQFAKQNSIQPQAMGFDFAYAMANKAAGEGEFLPRGLGMGADIGFSYIRKKNSRLYKIGCPSFIRKICFMPNYKWKFGASIIDIGGISFSTLAQQYSFNQTALRWDSISYAPVKTIQQLDQTLHEKALNPNSIEKGLAFYMSLPTALSLQFDYNINDAVFINTTWVQRIALSSGAGVRRMNVLAVTPRYETDQIELAVPVQLYEYNAPAIGLMARYRSVFIGTDQLGSTMGLTKLNGADLYIGFKMALTNDYSPSAMGGKRKRPTNLNKH